MGLISKALQNGHREKCGLASGVLLVVCLIGAAVFRRRRFENRVRTHIDTLLAEREKRTVQQYTHQEIADLPEPARLYFEEVLTDGQPIIQAVKLRQYGEFRLGGVDAAWYPLTATQSCTTQPPGFVWDATIEILPAVPTRVIDLYKQGEGILRAQLLGVIPVASVGPNPEMNEGELVRYLAEAVWYPTALLPSQGVTWSAIDNETARATLEHRGVTASLVFHFDDQNHITHVITDRYRQEDDTYLPWTGSFRDYENRHGVQIPTTAEVGWCLPEGELPYWRATIEELTYSAA